MVGTRWWGFLPHMPIISIGRYSSCLGPIRLSDGSHESSVLWEHTPAAAVPYLGLGAEISLVGYVLKTPPVGILDVPFFYCALRQCVAHVPVRHKITNPLIPQQAGVIPMPTGSHYQGLVLC